MQELGCHALAIVQAAAYIAQTEWELTRYVEHFEIRRGALLDQYKNQKHKVDSYSLTVYTTWRISYDRLSARGSSLMHICAFLHHEGIFEAIFENAATQAAEYEAEEGFEEVGQAALHHITTFLADFRTSEEPWDVIEFQNTFLEIKSYSLIQFDAHNQAYSIHPLVHEWTQMITPDAPLVRNSVQWLLGLSIFWDFRSEDYAFRQRILPHVMERDPFLGSMAPWMLMHVALVYEEGFNYAKAEELKHGVVDAYKRVQGEEHRSTLASMNNLAETYRLQGRYKEAEELDARVAEARKRVLGEEHRDTLTSMHNLAGTYHEQGRYKEAEELYVGVVEARKRVLGEEHRDTLLTMANLAGTYREQGRYKEAEELYVGVVEACKRVLGEEHRDTLVSMHNLAWTYNAIGREEEAEALFLEVIDSEKRVRGDDHPSTVS